MFILIDYNKVLQSITDTWLPIIVPFVVLTLVFITIAIVRKEKDSTKEGKDEKNEK